MLKILCIFLWGCAVIVQAEEKECPFCNPQVLEAQSFYEDELVWALYTHEPILPGHCLIIPKRHIERFEMLTEEESLQIYRTIQKVDRAVTYVYGTCSYLLLQKNGAEVGQSVPHMHVHYIPRQKGDGSIMKFIMRMFQSKMHILPAEEMKKNVEKLQEALFLMSSFSPSANPNEDAAGK